MIYIPLVVIVITIVDIVIYLVVNIIFKEYSFLQKKFISLTISSFVSIIMLIILLRKLTHL